MDLLADNKTAEAGRDCSPRTIRKKSLPPYDRHILKIDRARFELSPSTSSNQSASSYQSSLQQTLLKKKSLRQFALELSGDRQKQLTKRKLYRRSTAPLKIFRVNGWKDNYYTNLLDWSQDNFICAALHNDLYFYNMTIDDELQSSLYRRYHFQKIEESINSIKFSSRGTKIAIGYTSGNLVCYDYFREKVAISRKNNHEGRITAIDWQANTILSGGKDKILRAVDIKSGEECIKFPKVHHQQICSIKSNGNLLASGGNDNLVSIYDCRKPERILTCYQHSAAIKALDWIKNNTLLSGGGTTDGKIKFWHDGVGVYQEINTGSQICGLKASINTDEIVTCQGYSLNQIIIWSGLGQREMNIHGHSERILYCALSPSAQHLVTGAGDQQMKIWKLFPKKQSSKWGFNELR